MITGYTFFRIHQALKLHFTSKYDVVKYKGKSPNTTYEKFESRSDKHTYEKWAKLTTTDLDAGALVMSNMLLNDTNYIYNDADLAIKIYKKWKKEHDAVTYYIEEDFKKLNQILRDQQVFYDNLFQKTPKGSIAPILQMYLAAKVLPDTICYLSDSNNDFISKWVKEYEDDPMISKIVFKLQKYVPLCKINKVKLAASHSDIFLPWEK